MDALHMDPIRIQGVLEECEKKGAEIDVFEGIGLQIRRSMSFGALYVTCSGKWLLRPMLFVTHYMGTYLDPGLYKYADQRQFWLNIMKKLIQAHQSDRLLIDSASQTVLNGDVLQVMLDLSVDAAERVKFFQECHEQLQSLFEERVIKTTFKDLEQKYQVENGLLTALNAYEESRKELGDFLMMKNGPESLTQLWQLRQQLVTKLSQILPRGSFNECPEEILNGYLGSVPRCKEIVDLLLNG